MLANKTEICRVTNQFQLDQFIQQGGVKVYQDCFSEPPYEESFSSGEVENLFSLYLASGILFSASVNDQALGFAAAIPLLLEEEIALLARKNSIDPEKTWYFADLGVDKNVRRKRMGTQLVLCLLGELKNQDLIMRTSENNLASRKLNENLGFRFIPEMNQQVEQKRQSGQVASDRRIFLIYENKQKRQD